MIDLSLAAIANQAFFVQLEDHAYSIALHASGNSNIVSVDISRDDVVLVSGARIDPGTPLLPYKYQEAGNFVLIVNDGDLPDFEQFGNTQFLVYLTADELVELRAA